MLRSSKFQKCLAFRNLSANKSYSTESSTQTQETSIAEKIEKPERLFFKNQDIIDGFKVFDPYMNKFKEGFAFSPRTKAQYSRTQRDKFARYYKMSVDQDWNNVWPTSSMFKQSVVPLPVRQGYVKNASENDGLPPEKYGNTELIKIPNFLHLTPPQIKKQCAAIKKFCTKWPEELKTDEDCEKNFPIEITTSTYIYDGPSIRDERSRKVTLQIKLSALNLDSRSRYKFIRLIEDRYDPNTDIVTIESERCPYRHQNEDYVYYLLTTLYFESKKIEDWESEMVEDDWEFYDWDKSKSKPTIVKTVAKVEKIEENDLEKLINLNQVKKYQESITKLFDQGETNTNILQYKQSVLNLLKLKSKSN